MEPRQAGEHWLPRSHPWYWRLNLGVSPYAQQDLSAALHPQPRIFKAIYLCCLQETHPRQDTRKLAQLQPHTIKHQGEVDEHGNRAKNGEGESECLRENAKEKRDKSDDLRFFKTLNCSWIMLSCPGVADRSEFTEDYSLQLAIVIYLYAAMEKHGFPVWPARRGCIYLTCWRPNVHSLAL